MIRERMLEARDLIQRKRYAEARVVLSAIDHPKAREWLGRLDLMVMQQAQTSLASERAEASRRLPVVTPQPLPGAAEAPITPASGYSRRRSRRWAIGLAIVAASLGALVGIFLWSAVASMAAYDVEYVGLSVGFLATLGAALSAVVVFRVVAARHR